MGLDGRTDEEANKSCQVSQPSPCGPRTAKPFETKGDFQPRVSLPFEQSSWRAGRGEGWMYGTLRLTASQSTV